MTSMYYAQVNHPVNPTRGELEPNISSIEELEEFPKVAKLLLCNWQVGQWERHLDACQSWGKGMAKSSVWPSNVQLMGAI